MDGQALEDWLISLCEHGAASALERIAKSLLLDSVSLRTQQPAPEFTTSPGEPSTLERPADALDEGAGERSARNDWAPLLKQADAGLKAAGFQLHCALRHSVEVFGLTPDRFSELIDANRLFGWDREGLIAGVGAWMNEDHFTAFQALIPQVEHTVVRLLRRIGEPITHPLADGIMTAVYGETFAHDYGRDLQLQLLTVYVDARGWNLRDRFMRGLIPREAIHAGVTNWLIHLLLVIGGIPWKT